MPSVKDHALKRETQPTQSRERTDPHDSSASATNPASFVATWIRKSVLFLGNMAARNVTVRNVTVRQSRPFTIHLGNIRDFTVDGLTLDRHGRDGVHVDGPASDGIIRNVGGDSHDDPVSLTAWDWRQYSASFGPVRLPTRRRPDHVLRGRLQQRPAAGRRRRQPRWPEVGTRLDRTLPPPRPAGRLERLGVRPAGRVDHPPCSMKTGLIFVVGLLLAPLPGLRSADPPETNYEEFARLSSAHRPSRQHPLRLAAVSRLHRPALQDPP